MAEKKFNVLDDLVHFSRVALNGDEKEVGAYVRRLIRKVRADHPALASELEAMLASTKSGAKGASARRYSPISPGPVDGETRLELLRAYEPQAQIPAPIFTKNLAEAFGRILLERERAAQLKKVGLEPTKSVLMVGPPGVGKTLTAHWLASRLDLPLFVLNLSSVMSSYLGRTGANIRNIMAHFQNQKGILFLDEFDAIAKKRSDDSDIGELRRLVTVILQELDNWQPSNLLLAATNHSELLDPAIWRRFDHVIEFPLPTESGKQEKVSQIFGPSVDKNLVKVYAALWGDISYSEIERMTKSLVRRSIIDSVDIGGLVERTILENLDGLDKARLKDTAKSLIDAGLSQRKVSEMTSLSRDTIRSALREESQSG